MTLELASVPLAVVAGVLGILSPCVWPLVPVVMSSAAAGGRAGPWVLSAGLSLAFALAGTALSFVLVNAGLDREWFRVSAGGLLGVIALVLLVKPLGDWLSSRLAALSGRFEANGPATTSVRGQFGVGALLGLVWLPCIGPTLGAAVGLASLGQDVVLAFIVMLAYGLGTGAVLLAAGFASHRALRRYRPALATTAAKGRSLLGWALLLLSSLVLSGLDRRLEALAVPLLPEWAVSL